MDGLTSYMFHNGTVMNDFRDILYNNITDYKVLKNSILIDSVSDIARKGFSENQIRVSVKIDMDDTIDSTSVSNAIMAYINTESGLLQDCKNSTNAVLRKVNAANTDMNEFKRQTTSVDHTNFYFIVISSIVIFLANLMISLCIFCVAGKDKRSYPVHEDEMGDQEILMTNNTIFV